MKFCLLFSLIFFVFSIIPETFQSGQNEFMAAINNGISLCISNGELQQFSNKWFPPSISQKVVPTQPCDATELYFIPKNELTVGGILNEILTKQVIRFGGLLESPLNFYNSNNTLVGWEVDFANCLVEQISSYYNVPNISIEWVFPVKNSFFSDLQNGLLAGDYDAIIADMFYTAARAAVLDLSCPYQVSTEIIIRGPKDPQIKIQTIQDLNNPNLIIVLIPGSTDAALASAIAPNAQKIFVTNSDEQYILLNTSSADIMLTGTTEYTPLLCPSCYVISNITLQPPDYVVIGILKPNITSSTTNNSSLPIILGVAIPVVFLLISGLVVLFIFLYIKKRKLSKTKFDDPSQSNNSFELETQNLISGIEKLERLGQGEFAEVYKGRRSDSSLVALKVLKDDSKMKEFMKEASFLSKLQHQNIVQYFGIFVDENQKKYIVMEYMSNGNLKFFLQQTYEKKTLLSTVNLVQIATSALSGLVFLEEKNIVHRDIALRNFLVRVEGTTNENFQYIVKISDFGLSKILVNREEYVKKPTDEGIPIRWSAPEVIRIGKYSSKSDCWAWGVTMYELFSHAQYDPFYEYTTQQLAKELGSLKPTIKLEKPENVPDDIWAIAQECMAIEPEERPFFSQVLKSISNLLKKMRIEEDDAKQEEKQEDQNNTGYVLYQTDD